MPAETMKLSDLELAVLGIVGRDGPCTAYAIRQTFKRSPSPRFSGSAGAIYPLMARLTERGLLLREQNHHGRRQCATYTLSPAGLTRLRKWLRETTDRDAVIDDPLRLKLLFSGHLTPQERNDWLTRSIELIERKAAEFEALRPNNTNIDPTLHKFARWNVICTLRARADWLRRVRDDLAEES